MKILEQFTYSDFGQAHDFLILAWAVFDYASTNQIPQETIENFYQWWRP